MTAVVEWNGVLYIGTADGTGIMRYNVNNAVWESPWGAGSDIVDLKSDGTSLFAATEFPTSIIEMSATGSTLTTFASTGCYPSSATISGMYASASHIVASFDTGVFTSIERSTGACTAYDTTNGLPTSFLGDVAIWGTTAYVATENKGVLRYDITNDSWLEPWGSTGINGVDNAPVAMVGDVLHLGLQGYGVARKDLSTGEILLPSPLQTEVGLFPLTRFTLWIPTGSISTSERNKVLASGTETK